jgi:hypothetical protein
MTQETGKAAHAANQRLAWQVSQEGASHPARVESVAAHFIPLKTARNPAKEHKEHKDRLLKLCVPCDLLRPIPPRFPCIPQFKAQASPILRACKCEINVESLGMGKTIQYPTRFNEQDADLRQDLEHSAQRTGQSVNQLILACVRAALPRVVEALAPGGGRVTNVDPLPEDVLRRIYANPEEEDEKGVQRFMSAQALGGED